MELNGVEITRLRRKFYIGRATSEEISFLVERFPKNYMLVKYACLDEKTPLHVLENIYTSYSGMEEVRGWIKNRILAHVNCTEALRFRISLSE